MLFYKNKKLPFIIAFSLFILAALYGFLIRWNFVFPIADFPYKNMLQSHSHVAFLGWGYIVTITVIIKLYLSEIQQNKSIYKLTFSILIISIFLMLFSFPLGGYKVFSIVLLSIFGITSYILSYRLLNDLKEKTIAVKFIKFGIYYYILSSLATWFLAYVLIVYGKTNLYYNTVYFYLHFLYNGFFVFVLFGIFFKIIDNNKLIIKQKDANNFFVYLNIACIPSYALSILWSDVASIYYVIGFAASFLQIIALFFLFKLIKNTFILFKLNPISKILSWFWLIAFSLKIVMQFFSSFPYFVEKSLALKPFFIIGYLHLYTLGFMSVFLIFIVHKVQIISFKSTFSKTGIFMFLLGVLVTELLFFSQGFLLLIQSKMIENYQFLLLIFSGILVLGLIFIYFEMFKLTKKQLS